MKTDSREVQKLTRLSEGGEGVIYAWQDKVMKIYKEHVDVSSKEKKIHMLMEKKLPREVIRPLDTVVDQDGRMIGFLMERVEGEEIRRLANTKYRKAHRVDTRETLAVLIRMRQVIAQIHKAGICIGDLNDRNILFNRSGDVFFIDCDSWCVGTENCQAVMELFRDPLMRDDTFTEETDLYAACIIIWELLTGIHPYGGTTEPDLKLAERMRRGICVIDNPAVKIPRTVRGWQHMSPALVAAMKKVFEHKSRKLGGELEAMYAGLHSGGDAFLMPVMIAAGNETEAGRQTAALLRGEEVRIVWNEFCYLDRSERVVCIATGERMPWEAGVRYHFLGDGTAVSAYPDRFCFTAAGRFYTMAKRYGSGICTDGNDIYYITPGDTLMRVTVTESGNGIRPLAGCGYEAYFAVEAGSFCLVSRSGSGLAINCDGKYTELDETGRITDYGIHRDSVRGSWLVTLENGDGSFRICMTGKGAASVTEQIRYPCSLGNLCIADHTLYVPMDGQIRAYALTKRVYRDFACEAVSAGSRLVKRGNGFLIVNDENIYCFPA